MVYTPDYTIELKDGRKIPLLFHTWMFLRYSELKGLEYEDLFRKIQNTIPQEKGQKAEGAKFSSLELPDIMLLAHQCYCKYNNLECTATDLDAAEWLHEMGGLFGGIQDNTKIFTLFVARLLNVDDSQLSAEKLEKGPEKKKEKGKSSPGGPLSALPRRRA